MRGLDDGRYLAWVVDGPDGPVVERLMRVPRSRLLQPRWWSIWAGQQLVLTTVATVVWLIILQPLLRFVP